MGPFHLVRSGSCNGHIVTMMTTITKLPRERFHILVLAFGAQVYVLYRRIEEPA